MKILHIGDIEESAHIELMVSVRGSFYTMIIMTIRLFIGAILAPLAWALKKPILFGVKTNART